MNEKNILNGINLGRWSKENTNLKYEYNNEYNNEVTSYKLPKKQLEKYLKDIDKREVHYRKSEID